MKSKFIIILLLAVSFSCTTRNDNPEITQLFNSCIDAVNEYDLYIGNITDSILAKFYFSTEYLTDLTHIKAKYVSADVPRYKTRQDCLNDMKQWKRWYKRNGNSITKEYSDSIVSSVLEKNIWWQYNPDSCLFRVK